MDSMQEIPVRFIEESNKKAAVNWCCAYIHERTEYRFGGPEPRGSSSVGRP